jgi:hypothetical protein
MVRTPSLDPHYVLRQLKFMLAGSCKQIAREALDRTRTVLRVSAYFVTECSWNECYCNCHDGQTNP